VHACTVPEVLAKTDATAAAAAAMLMTDGDDDVGGALSRSRRSV